LSEAAVIDVKAGMTYDQINLVLQERSPKKYRIQGRIVATALPALPGLAPDMYLKEARFDSSDVRYQPLRISETSSNSLNIEIGTKGGLIEGTVHAPNGRRGSGAKVSLVPDDRSRRDLFRFATAGEDGQFAVQGIAPGDYKIFAFESRTENFVAFDQDWIRSYEPKGLAVHAQKGSKESVNVGLITEP
jgi:hypothetical protein